jgi:hypothetical protein
MVFTDGEEAKIRHHELQNKMAAMRFFAMGARDLLMAECRSTDIYLNPDQALSSTFYRIRRLDVKRGSVFTTE